MEPLGEVSSMVKHRKIIPDASHTLYIFVMLLTKDNALGTIFFLTRYIEPAGLGQHL